MKARITILAMAALLLVVLSITATAQDIAFNYKDVNAPGATQTDSYAINNGNKITGDYIDSSGGLHGMILKGTNLKTIDDSKGNTTQGFGINTGGVVVGWYISNTTGLPVGFKYANGKFSDIVVPNSIETEATGINDNGVIVGLYLDANSVQHGFKKKGTTYTTIDLNNMTATAAWGINNNNTITAYGNDAAGNFHSFALHYNGKSKVKILDPNTGSLGTVVHTPNNNGDIVMTYFDASNFAHGSLLKGGKYTTLDDPNADGSAGGTRGDGLNDSDVSVGRYSAADGSTHGFKATPQ